MEELSKGNTHSSLGAGGNPKPSFASSSLCCLDQPPSLYSSPLNSKEYLQLAMKGSPPIRGLHRARAGDPMDHQDHPGISAREQSHKLGRMHKPSFSQDLCSLFLSHTQIK